MNRNTQNEVEMTLKCMGRSGDVQVGPEFTDGLCERVAALRVSHTAGYQGRAFYPAAILLMVVLNVAALLLNFQDSGQVGESATDATAVMAQEYGMTQNDYMSL